MYDDIDIIKSTSDENTFHSKPASAENALYHICFYSAQNIQNTFSKPDTSNTR